MDLWTSMARFRRADTVFSSSIFGAFRGCPVIANPEPVGTTGLADCVGYFAPWVSTLRVSVREGMWLELCAYFYGV